MAKHQPAKKQPWKPGDPKPHKEPKRPEKKEPLLVEAKVFQAADTWEEPEVPTLTPPSESVEPVHHQPPGEPEPEKEPKNLVDQIHLALFGLQIEVQGGIPAISHKCLTENGITTIIQKLQDEGIIKP